MTALQPATDRLPMPALVSVARALPPHVAIGSSPRILLAAARRGVNLAIWKRVSSAATRTMFTALAREDLGVDVVVAVGDVSLRLRPVLPAVLAVDVAALARRYARLTGATRLRVKVESVGGDECRLFHVDHVGWRLITTWAGPGTDWLEDEACRREHLGGRGLPGRPSVDAINAGIVADWTRVHRADRHAVLLCRGITACDAHTLPLVHRSPPIADTGLRQLRLVIDDASHDHHSPEGAR